MAYKNLVSQNCTGFTEEVFQRIRDFICKRNGTYDYSTTGIGWTLHDSYYATDEDNCAIGDWFVVKSVGESGDEDMYYHFKWHEADHLCIHGMLYWNAGTNTGVQVYGVATLDILYADDDAAVVLWIYGDLDHFSIITKPTTIYYAADAGRTVNSLYDCTVATCAGALSSGSDISITVDIVPSEWAVNRYLFIRDTANIERIKIKTLVGTTITADLTNSYLAGNKLAADLCYYHNANNQIGSGKSVLIGHQGTKFQSLTPYYHSALAYANPDEMNGEPAGGALVLGSTAAGVHGEIKDIMRIAPSIVGVNSEDVFTDMDGIDWRVFNTYNSVWLVFREV